MSSISRIGTLEILSTWDRVGIVCSFFLLMCFVVELLSIIHQMGHLSSLSVDKLEPKKGTRKGNSLEKQMALFYLESIDRDVAKKSWFARSFNALSLMRLFTMSLLLVTLQKLPVLQVVLTSALFISFSISTFYHQKHSKMFEYGWEGWLRLLQEVSIGLTFGMILVFFGNIHINLVNLEDSRTVSLFFTILIISNMLTETVIAAIKLGIIMKSFGEKKRTIIYRKTAGEQSQRVELRAKRDIEIEPFEGGFSSKGSTNFQKSTLKSSKYSEKQGLEKFRKPLGKRMRIKMKAVNSLAVGTTTNKLGQDKRVINRLEKKSNSLWPRRQKKTSQQLQFRKVSLADIL